MTDFDALAENITAVAKAGMTAEEAAAAMRRIAPYMPELPVPSRWSAFKRWVRGAL